MNDPVNGDSFHQTLTAAPWVGGNVSAHLRPLNARLGATELRWAIHTRYDDIDLGLTNTFQRQPGSIRMASSIIRTDQVREAIIPASMLRTRALLDDWLRTTLVLACDYYAIGRVRFDPRCQ